MQSMLLKREQRCPSSGLQEISLDHPTDCEFIEHALDWLRKNDEMPDFTVHLRPTTPT